jgi:1,4-dihydroxy-2-naphthoate octaprenyltransferase
MSYSGRNRLVLFFLLARPWFLLGAALLYAMGVGIARYLGTPIDWGLYLLGQGWVTSLQLSTHFLNEYFNTQADRENPNRTPFSGGSGMLGAGRLPKRTALLAAYSCLAVLASLTVLLIASANLVQEAYVIMVIAFLGAVFYSTPPVRLESSGYGELTTSILVAYLVPAFALVLQAGQIHRFLTILAFPLTLIHLAMLMTFELPDYATDLKFGKRTLLVRLGWQRGMTLHDLLLISAYLVLGLAAILGLPSFLVISIFLTLPLAALEIWQMRRIAGGAKPNWLALTLNAAVIFGAMAYLVTFAFWTH